MQSLVLAKLNLLSPGHPKKQQTYMHSLTDRETLVIFTPA